MKLFFLLFIFITACSTGKKSFDEKGWQEAVEKGDREAES